MYEDIEIDIYVCMYMCTVALNLGRTDALIRFQGFQRNEEETEEMKEWA